MNLRRFFIAKDTDRRTQWQLQKWEKIFTGYISDVGLISEIYRELIKADIKKPNQLKYEVQI